MGRKHSGCFASGLKINHRNVRCRSASNNSRTNLDPEVYRFCFCLFSHRQSWPSLPPRPRAWWDIPWWVPRRGFMYEFHGFYDPVWSETEKRLKTFKLCWRVKKRVQCTWPWVCVVFKTSQVELVLKFKDKRSSCVCTTQGFLRVELF